jgi:MoxR-like ATPase
LARAKRITTRGRELLSSQPTDAESIRRWRLQLEGVAREIDAGFAADSMPEEIASLRRELVTILRDGS